MSDRFPTNIPREADENPAVLLYGNRFYKDQTPVEYLAELLLVFASPKGPDPNSPNNLEFTFSVGETSGKARYWPQDRITLKLFAFFPTSVLDTRHEVHEKAYTEALDCLSSKIEASPAVRDETIRLLQSLFSGFVGVSGNRTWVTYSFLPASSSLLSRELAWLHTRAARHPPTSWEDARQYFAPDRHIFMARGGESLFLQLANFFHNGQSIYVALTQNRAYSHLKRKTLPELKVSLEENLASLLQTTTQPLNQLSSFVESALSDFRLYDEPKHALLGWVPATTSTVAAFFAVELENVLTSSLSNLEKVEHLQNLCCLQVLRTLSYIASHADTSSPDVDGFVGGYTWIAVSETLAAGTPSRKLAENSLSAMEQVLYRVLRANPDATGSMTEAQKHGFDVFRKLSKLIGLVIPRTGKGARFVLPPHLIHLFVIALIAPGQRIPLDRFFDRVFAHYGIALGPRQLAAALAHQSGDADVGHHDYAIAADTRWIEEALRQGDFLVELSDAVSIVRNPAAKVQEPE